MKIQEKEDGAFNGRGGRKVAGDSCAQEREGEVEMQGEEVGAGANGMEENGDEAAAKGVGAVQASGSDRGEGADTGWDGNLMSTQHDTAQDEENLETDINRNQASNAHQDEEDEDEANVGG